VWTAEENVSCREGYTNWKCNMFLSIVVQAFTVAVAEVIVF
jgi:hypothetical protein